MYVRREGGGHRTGRSGARVREGARREAARRDAARRDAARREVARREVARREAAQERPETVSRTFGRPCRARSSKIESLYVRAHSTSP